MRLALIILFTVLTHAAFNGSRVTISLYALKLQATPFTVGVLMSLYALLPMLLSVWAGRLVDRIGARTPVLWSTLLLIAGVILPFAWPGLPALYIASTVIGTSFMMLHVTMNNVVGALGRPEDRTANFSWLALGFSVSGFLGPMIAGFAIDGVGHRWTFPLLCAMPLASLLLFVRIRAGFPHKRAAPAARAGTPAPRVMDLLADRRMRAVFIASGLLSMGWDLFTFVIPIYCSRVGLSASTIGVIMGSFAAATFAVRMLMPALARRLKEWQVITASLLISGIAYSLFPLFDSVGPLIALSCLLGLGLGCAQPMVMALLYAASPPGRQGEAIGIRTTVLNTSSTVLPLISGALGAALGMGPVFWIMSAMLGAGSWAAARKARKLALAQRG
jgi:predicted MFS family arabinose efflux permease